MEGVGHERPTMDALLHAELVPLVRSLAVAEGHEQAADAVQEAFVQAGRRWGGVASRDDPAGWVRRLAVNRVAISRPNRRRRAELSAAVQPPDAAGLSALDLDLLAAVRALPADQRRCLCLHHIGGYPVEDVATALEIAPGTVKAHLHDGHAALRRALEGSNDGK
jgi:RNA polymerase sigma-70 factor, ECF subfamily